MLIILSIVYQLVFLPVNIYDNVVFFDDFACENIMLQHLLWNSAYPKKSIPFLLFDTHFLQSTSFNVVYICVKSRVQISCS